MSDEKKKTVKFEKVRLENIPDNKPAVYKILNAQGENIYTGSAMRGRVQERLQEHLPKGSDPIRGGVKVHIKQKSSIAEAEKTEKIIISRSKPNLINWVSNDNW